MPKVFRDAMRIFSDKGARFLGAAVAFYALLSAAPLFVVILAIVGAVFGRGRAENALWDGLGVWVAPEGLAAMRDLTDRLHDRSASGGLVGIVLVVYGSTRLFRGVRRALNQLWGIDLERIERGRSKVVKYGVRYGGALLLTIFVALLVAALIIVKAGFAALATYSARPVPALWWLLDVVVSVVFTFVLFTALFRFLPETEVSWREAMLSAAVSTALFAVGSGLVTLYIGHKHMSALYEGASALVLAVVWVYYSAQVFFLGACVGAALRAHERPVES